MKEFKFRGFDENSEQTRNAEKSLWNIDGEILEKVNIDVKVHCQLVPVYARGRERDPKRRGQDKYEAPPTTLKKSETADTVIEEFS